MARKVVTLTTLVDDLNGEAIEDGQGETIKFGFDGTNYEIDLGPQNAKALRDVFKPYVKVARKSGRGGGSSSANRTDKAELAAAREWLRSNGHEVSDRGRIPTELMELYRSSK